MCVRVCVCAHKKVYVYMQESACVSGYYGCYTLISVCIRHFFVSNMSVCVCVRVCMQESTCISARECVCLTCP